MRFHFIETLEEANEFKRWLSERGTVACDTETTGLSPENDRLRTVQFGDADEGWCIPVEGIHSWAGFVKDIFLAYRGQLIFHNLKFDLRFLDRGLGTTPRGELHDTSVLAALQRPGKRVALKPLAGELLGSWATDPQSSLDGAYRRTGWKWDSVPVDHPDFWRYACFDTCLTYSVFDSLGRGARVPSDLYDLERSTIGTCLSMERRGAKLDVGYCTALSERWDDDTRNIIEWAHRNYGAGFNLFSGVQLAAALVGDGVELSKRTPTGSYSTDESVLGSIDHPLARATLLAKRLRKWSAVYLDSFQRSANFDGRVHCSIRTIGARTGRMSITDPPMQTLPRGAFVRDCIIPSDGNVLVSVDYDAVEMRLAAHLSGDSALINLLESGESIHDYAARNIYGPDFTSDQRQGAKNGGYCIMYGGGVRRLSHTIGAPEPEAARFRDGWLASFPQLRMKMQEIEKVGRRRLLEEGEPYVTTVGGRKNVVDPDKLYRLTNAWIQGSAADLLKQKLVELEACGFGEYMILPIHDEVLFDIPATLVDEVLPEIERTMTVDGLAIPLTVHGEVLNERWGDKYRSDDPDFDTTFLDGEDDSED